jgi:hypothetical protein
MKRTSRRERPELALRRRLALVRVTIRELTSSALEQVHGGIEAPNAVTCIPGFTRITDDCAKTA